MSMPDRDFEYALRQLRPRPPRLDMAQTMYRAGQASGWWRLVPWMASTGILLVVVMIQWVIISRDKAPAPVEQPSTVMPAEIPDMSTRHQEESPAPELRQSVLPLPDSRERPDARSSISNPPEDRAVGGD